MENRKNLGSSVKVSNLKPGIHEPFVYIVVLLKSQSNSIPIEDLNSHIQVHDLFHCSDEGRCYHLHFTS